MVYRLTAGKTMDSGIRKIFSEVPRTYEAVNHILTFGLDIVLRKKAARLASEGGGKLWLDICSGTGETAVYLSRLAPAGTRVMAADFSLPMISVAMKKRDARCISFVLSDAGKLPFEDSTFDLVAISFATRNINLSREALSGAFREFLRILRPGGRFVNLETSRPPSVIVRGLMHAYVKLVVRLVGEFISGSRAGYSYLSSTIPRFYPAEELAAIIKNAGFSKVGYSTSLAGAFAIHKAVK